MPSYQVVQMGLMVGEFGTLEEARSEADRINAEHNEIVGDGAASVVEVPTAEECVEHAVEYLGAEPLECGCAVYYAEETGRYYTAQESELEDLGRALISGEPDAYSIWCSTSGEPSTRAELAAAGIQP